MPDDETSEVTLAAELIAQEHVDVVCGRYDKIDQDPKVDVALLQAKNEEQSRTIAELQAKLAVLVEIKMPKDQSNDKVNQTEISASAESEKGQEGNSADASGSNTNEASQEDNQSSASGPKGNRR